MCVFPPAAQQAENAGQLYGERPRAACVRPSRVCSGIGSIFTVAFPARLKMGRLAAHFHLKICSISAQNRRRLTGICCRDPIQAEHLGRSTDHDESGGFPRLHRRPTVPSVLIMNHWSVVMFSSNWRRIRPTGPVSWHEQMIVFSYERISDREKGVTSVISTERLGDK